MLADLFRELFTKLNVKLHQWGNITIQNRDWWKFSMYLTINAYLKVLEKNLLKYDSFTNNIIRRFFIFKCVNSRTDYLYPIYSILRMIELSDKTFPQILSGIKKHIVRCIVRETPFVSKFRNQIYFLKRHYYA